MEATIVPEPTEDERDAILAALAASDGEPERAWAMAALAEGLDTEDP